MPVDLEADSNLRQWAEQRAQQAYYEAMASGQGQDRALAAAKFEWQKRLDEATQTGMWNGQYNMPTEQWYATNFGQWYGPGGTPQAGDQTLAGAEQQFRQGLDTSALYGQYYAPGQTPTAGQQTLSAQNQANQLGLSQANLTGWYLAPGQTGQGTQTLAGSEQGFTQNLRTEQEQRAAQAQTQSQAQAYLQLLSNLRGPADWAKYQQVLGSTPNGMRDLVAAAMGQYVPGGGATTGYQPQAASLQSMMGQVAGQPYYGQGGGQLNMPSPYQGGQAAYGQQGGGQTWGSGIGIGAQQPTPDQQQQGLGGGTNLPAPNQIAAESWKNLAPSQQQLFLGMYENQGWNKDDVMALMNQNLPKYGATNAATAGTWSLK